MTEQVPQGDNLDANVDSDPAEERAGEGHFVDDPEAAREDETSDEVFTDEPSDDEARPTDL